MQHSISKQWRNLVLTTVLYFFTISPSFAFGIDISLSGFTATQKDIITQAEHYWESVITGYQPGISGITGIIVDASSSYIDGSGGILGQAGPEYGFIEGGYIYTYSGSMEFDSADIADLESDGDLFDVIVHELAHIIGFGTLWTYNDLVDNNGQYIGAAALAAYQAEFDPSAAFIPVELDGGPGTAYSHWDESIDMYELMTGWLDNPSYVSNTTKASFIDLGYTIAIATVPLPAAFWLFGSGFLGFIGWAKRKQTT